MNVKKILTIFSLVLALFPLGASAATVRPGYQWFNKKPIWTDGPVLPSININAQTRKKFVYNSETIVGSVVPVFPTNANVIFISTVSYPDNGLASYKIYTYHLKKGTARLMLEETARLDAGAAYSYEPIGMDGKRLVLRRVDSSPHPLLPCEPTIDWYLYTYRYNLVSVNVYDKVPRFNTYALPRDIFNRGLNTATACESEIVNETAVSNNAFGNNLEVGVGVNSLGLPEIAGCQMYSADSLWNKDISSSNRLAESQSFIDSLGNQNKLNAGFGSDVASGIPYNVIGKNTNWYDVRLMTGKAFSNPGPYPIPNDPLIEAGSNRRMIVLDNNSCYYYEFLNARRGSSDNSWVADLISVFYLKANWLRPQKWPAATASGVQLLPGLVKYDEVESGLIRHPLIFTAPNIQKKFLDPATAGGSVDNGSLPAFGARFRLKSEYDTSQLPFQARVIAESLKKYGMILADYGTPWTIMGASDPRWNDQQLSALKKIPGSAFDVIYSGAFTRIWFE